VGGTAHDLAENAATMVRLARDLPGFLRTPITLDSATKIVRQRLRTRNHRFLTMAERAVYRHPKSPYFRLFRNAGCELGDLASLVAREGLEGALRTLASHGVS